MGTSNFFYFMENYIPGNKKCSVGDTLDAWYHVTMEPSFQWIVCFINAYLLWLYCRLTAVFGNYYMKIDFHTHGKLAKYLPFSSDYTRMLFREAKNAGLDALCLTEHFNTLGFDEIYHYLHNHYEKQGDCYLVEGVKVFPGMEVDIKEGGHILVIGTVSQILSMNKDLEKNKDKDSFLTFKELLDLKKEYGVFTGAAHAYREGSNIPLLEEENLRQLDFTDLNGKDYAMKNNLAYEEIRGFAEKYKLPVVAGSDTHQSFQYGCIWNEFYTECDTVKELMQVIYSGRYEIKILDYIDFKVKTAGILKKALKEIHACGGDYISVLG